eukprot:9289652-Pyramimonas_sp.AAC.1
MQDSPRAAARASAHARRALTQLIDMYENYVNFEIQSAAAKESRWFPEQHHRRIVDRATLTTRGRARASHAA